MAYMYDMGTREILLMFEQITELMADRSNKGHRQRLEPYEYFICGSATGFIVAFVEGPIDLVGVIIFTFST